MLPILKPGQIIVGIPRKKISFNDVLILKISGKEIIKRVSLLGPEGVFVLGDNPDHSTDSRSFGWVAHDQIVASVIWPRL